MTLPLKRPKSWDAKMMLSGEPLITDRHFDQLLANGLKRGTQEANDLVPVLKIFLPHVRFLLVSLDADLDTTFSLVERGDKREAGAVSLTNIVNARLGGGSISVTPERDKYITLDQPWPHYLKNGNAWSAW